MSRKTTQNLTLADRMQDARIAPIWVDQVRTLVKGYGALRRTCSLLYKDNMALRARLRLEPLVKDDEVGK
jgi:hypothetical protein